MRAFLSWVSWVMFVILSFCTPQYYHYHVTLLPLWEKWKSFLRLCLSFLALSLSHSLLSHSLCLCVFTCIYLIRVYTLQYVVSNYTHIWMSLSTYTHTHIHANTVYTRAHNDVHAWIRVQYHICRDEFFSQFPYELHCTLWGHRIFIEKTIFG